MSLSASIFAIPFNHIVFFGDSLSDNGNVYKYFLHFIPKSPPYFHGRFSNGPTWAENLADYYFENNNIDFTMYAISGSTAVIRRPTSKYAYFSTLDLQVYDYIFRSAIKDKSKILYSIWVGSNDYVFYSEKKPEKLTDQVVGRISASISNLVASGAKYFLVLNSPDLALTPYAREHHSVEMLHEISILHNKKLSDEMEKLRLKYPAIKIILIDIYNIFLDFINNRDKYNTKYKVHVVNTTDACWGGNFYLKGLDRDQKLYSSLRAYAKENPLVNKATDIDSLYHEILSNPELRYGYMMSELHKMGRAPCTHGREYLFWDDLHPTGVVHNVLAQIIIEKVNEILGGIKE